MSGWLIKEQRVQFMLLGEMKGIPRYLGNLKCWCLGLQDLVWSDSPALLIVVEVWTPSSMHIPEFRCLKSETGFWLKSFSLRNLLDKPVLVHSRCFFKQVKRKMPVQLLIRIVLMSGQILKMWKCQIKNVWQKKIDCITCTSKDLRIKAWTVLSKLQKFSQSYRFDAQSWKNKTEESDKTFILMFVSKNFPIRICLPTLELRGAQGRFGTLQRTNNYENSVFTSILMFSAFMAAAVS